MLTHCKHVRKLQRISSRLNFSMKKRLEFTWSQYGHLVSCVTMVFFYACIIANSDIRRTVGCQPSDRRWSLNLFVDLCEYVWVNILLYHPWGTTVFTHHVPESFALRRMTFLLTRLLFRRPFLWFLCRRYMSSCVSPAGVSVDLVWLRKIPSCAMEIFECKRSSGNSK